MLADVPRHGRQRDGRPVVLLAESRAARRDASDQRRGLGGGVLSGQPLNRGCRHAGNALRPGRRLGHAILVSQNVGLELLKADCVLVQERLVLQILLDDHVGHGNQHGAIGARNDGNPLVGKGSVGFRVPGVDSHNPDPGVFGLGQVPRGVGVLNGD